ncbi:hypothetical protein AB0M28_30325 [Streptomyces sp. NPDC051940]|uniref:hypothetical protein n=1 Tax=Streptomyces sp. NPDC051940 TaxID=3155675 RepID=UPI0034279F48
MPTPYGSRGGMVFGPDELHTLRRALAVATQPQPSAMSDQDFADSCLRLLADVAEASLEAARRDAFVADELRRYRAALPGAAAGYTELLEQALADGHTPLVSDVAALRALVGLPAGAKETGRRRALLRRLEHLAARRTAQGVPPARETSRGRPLIALPGGRMSEETTQDPAPTRAPQKHPAAPTAPGTPPGRRPVPTPAEVFPPGRRRSSPPQADTPPGAEALSA